MDYHGATPTCGPRGSVAVCTCGCCLLTLTLKKSVVHLASNAIEASDHLGAHLVQARMTQDLHRHISQSASEIDETMTRLAITAKNEFVSIATVVAEEMSSINETANDIRRSLDTGWMSNKHFEPRTDLVDLILRPFFAMFFHGMMTVKSSQNTLQLSPIENPTVLYGYSPFNILVALMSTLWRLLRVICVVVTVC
jgi:hypothetical protein